MSIIGSANAFVARNSRSGYKISRSLRFNSADSANCTRSISSTGSATTATYSWWVKRGLISGARRTMFSHKISSSGINSTNFEFSASEALNITLASTADTNYVQITSAVFRDPSAWYHLVIAVDTTQATAANRVRIYVNGSEITTFSSTNYPPQNTTLRLSNSSYPHTIGVDPRDGTYFDGYITEFHSIDGQQLTPSSFGETDTITGVWKPKKYAGTYGTNGFYLNFSDNSGTTSTTLGKDSSGNSNNFTPNNFSVTAGAGNDSLIDTPTPYADGGNGRGNYCTLNPLDVGTTNMALSNGNLDFTKSSTNFGPARGTLAVTTGKWYFEMLSNNSNLQQVGVSNDFNIRASSGNVSVNATGGIGAAWDSRGFLYQTGAAPSYAFSYTTNDIVMVAFDAGSGKIWFGKNGTWNSGDPAAGTSPAFTASGYSYLTPFVNGESGGSGTVNFGQRPFAYTPPSGFKALNTQNLPEPSIKKPSSYMDVLTWSGTGGGSGATRSLTGLGFSPDLVWGKIRTSSSPGHILMDAVRGVGTGKYLQSNTTNAEGTSGPNESLYGHLSSLDSAGFTVTNGTSTFDNWNKSGDTYVAWCWDESATPGFDIVTYTGTGSATTVAHSLGVAPSMIVIKCRSNSSDWATYHASVGATKGLGLNLTNAAFTTSDYWNNTAPTSSVFTVGTNTDLNGSGRTYVAYLWSEVAGFSRFGSYIANASTDGPVAFCGFRPRYLLIKNTTRSGRWVIVDTARSPYNQSGNALLADGSDSEGTDYYLDVLSNGFKIRASSGFQLNNTSGDVYVFAAYAEAPFKYALAR